jgi:hypothetical protein
MIVRLNPRRTLGIDAHKRQDYASASMGGWLLSRRDSTIVARHEVPGIMRKIAPSQRCEGLAVGKNFYYIQNQVEHHRTRIFQQEYLAFLKRHELSFDDKNL